MYNVYDARQILPATILDTITEPIGHYLIKRFVAQENVFGCAMDNVPDLDGLGGPKELLQKLKSSKGVTINHTSVKQNVTSQTE